jgi:hypothetical protein
MSGSRFGLEQQAGPTGKLRGLAGLSTYRRPASDNELRIHGVTEGMFVLEGDGN